MNWDDLTDRQKESACNSWGHAIPTKRAPKMDEAKNKVCTNVQCSGDYDADGNCFFCGYPPICHEY